MSRLATTARICFDLLIFCGLCFTIYALQKWPVPYKRGFFCNDESLQYPYRESSIGVVTLVVVVLSVPGSVIAVVELFKRRDAVIMRSKDLQMEQSKNGCGIGRRLAQCYAQLGYYLFGMALLLITTDIAKYSVGRLRPHFMAVCQPQMPDGSSCADAHNHMRYIEQYSCKPSNASINSFALQQVNLSFPSAHTSIFFYAMVYVSIYVQAVLSTRISKLFKHLLQFAFIMVAWYVALTRISDYWHHWSDVAAGAVLGSVIAYLVAVYVANLFVKRSNTSQWFNKNSGSRWSSNSYQQQQHHNQQARMQVKSSNSFGSSGKSATPVLPAYTFGSVPYLAHPVQYGQTYHNYGYIP